MDTFQFVAPLSSRRFARHCFLTGLTALLAILLPSQALAQILVVSPHPDDDTIIASGVVQRALARGETVRVVYVTNGDLAGVDIGTVRQGEAVLGQSRLGVSESHVIFMGYPDLSLEVLRSDYPATTSFYTTPNGVSRTYASRGLGGADYHTHRFGSPGAHNWPTMVGDMADILDTFRPTHIFTTSQWDTHNDHETTYFLVAQAAAQVIASAPLYNPTLHKTTVWPGDTSWPAPLDATAYFTEIPKPHFDNRMQFNDLIWSEREALDVPPAMQSTAYATNPKYLAVEAHASQDGPEGYIGRWIHKDEFFWTEQFVGSNRPPVPAAGTDQQVAEGASVVLDGSGSWDRNGDAVTYQWRQSAGTPVTLSLATTAHPMFSAPVGLSADALFEFELVVSDGSLVSVADAVQVVVRAAVAPPAYGINVASLAAITASSERTSSGQTATKAVDGVAGGYPIDPTSEWVTTGEGVGAWLRLTWSTPVVVGKVALHDRPNSSDQLTAAIIEFSDGTTIPVGPLTNLGPAVEYGFTPREISWLRLIVQQVSASTGNIGLSELAVFEMAGNRPPVAAAGNDQTVNAGVAVALDGSSSMDPNGDPLGYRWTQVGGPPVTLQNAQSADPTFISPAATPGQQVLTFQLVVNDGTVNSAADTVTIRVRGTINWPPTASATAPTAASAGTSVTLNALSSSDPEGEPLSYQWTQDGGFPVTLSSNSSPQTGFTIPSDAVDGLLTFTLVVHDGVQASSPLQVSVQIVALPLATANLAPLAIVSASSERAPTQSASKAVDGIVDGFPSDATREWSTVVEKVGAWIELRWPAAYLINRIRLHDRPNPEDRILGGTLFLSDGSTIALGALPNDGTGGDVVFTPRRVSWVLFRVEAVSPTSYNTGLAEILVFEQAGSVADQRPSAAAGPDQVVEGGATVTLSGLASQDPEGASLAYQWSQVSGTAVTLFDSTTVAPSFTAPPRTEQPQILVFGLVVHDGVQSSVGDTIHVTVPAIPNTPPVANAGPDQTVAGGSNVTLSASGSSDANSDPLTLSWSQTSGPSVALTGASTTTPAFTAPAAISTAQLLVFQVTVQDGRGGSSVDSVQVTINAQAGVTNVALTATVTASSQASATQAAIKAVDGIAAGYPTNSAAEWATAAQRAGAWIQLNWAADETVNSIRLFDRPNRDDQITSGTLLFSDGTSVAFGALPNLADSLTLSFAPKTIRWVRMRVDTVSSRTYSVGLAEFQVLRGANP